MPIGQVGEKDLRWQPPSFHMAAVTVMPVFCFSMQYFMQTDSPNSPVDNKVDYSIEERLNCKVNISISIP